MCATAADVSAPAIDADASTAAPCCPGCYTNADDAAPDVAAAAVAADAYPDAVTTVAAVAVPIKTAVVFSAFATCRS